MPIYSSLARIVEFREPLTDQTCKEGENVTFTCVLNFDDVAVTWYKNGQKLQRARDVIITADGSRHQLTLNNVTATDVGVVLLRAENLKVRYSGVDDLCGCKKSKSYS